MSNLAELRWQCRRGTLELDKLLLCYLEMGYPIADIEEKTIFNALLALSDQQLLLCLLGGKPLASDALNVLANKIRRPPI